MVECKIIKTNMLIDMGKDNKWIRDFLLGGIFACISHTLLWRPTKSFSFASWDEHWIADSRKLPIEEILGLTKIL